MVTFVCCDDNEPTEADVELATARRPPFRYIGDRIIATDLTKRL